MNPNPNAEPRPPRNLPEHASGAVEGLPCLDCGAMAPLVVHRIADALCPNCGLVGHAVGSRAGEAFEAVCTATYRYRLARLQTPDLNDDDDVPF